MTEVQGRRVLLRPVTEDDVPALHGHWSGAEVRRYLWDGQVVSVERVREAVAESGRLFEREGVGLWGIRLTDEPDLVGCGGFWYFHEPPELELVLSLSPRRWGEGLARETAGVLLDYVFGELRWTTVQASADAPNDRSLRLMRAMGMRPAGKRPGEFGRIEVYRLTAAERAVSRDRGGPVTEAG